MSTLYTQRIAEYIIFGSEWASERANERANEQASFIKRQRRRDRAGVGVREWVNAHIMPNIMCCIFMYNIRFGWPSLRQSHTHSHLHAARAVYIYAGYIHFMFENSCLGVIIALTQIYLFLWIAHRIVVVVVVVIYRCVCCGNFKFYLHVKHVQCHIWK